MSEYEIAEEVGGRYNIHLEYNWRTHVNALPMRAKEYMDSICNSKWGWYFTPHPTMQWDREDWYKDQTLIITFEDEHDLARCKLSVDLT
jgi:hypothetical protein